ncbi:MAG TPA: flagellar filament capping protein FliD [Bryobacteraceae bacterium]|nr:flagellar filament capping protein FliD [Bryobacteraceae bacterium]
MGTVGSILSASNGLASLSSATSGNGAGSSSTSSSSSANPSDIFTGTSTYSQDFQNIINHAVAIASLPIDLLTGQQTALSNQSTELQTLNTKFTALQTAVQSIQDAMGGANMQTTLSDPTVADVTLGTGATEGVYSIEVTDQGAYATSLSSQTWNGTASSSGKPTTYNLIVNGQSYSITPTDNSAATVASTINAQYGNLVNATSVNVGTADSPDTRISLQSATLGPMNLDIQVPANAGLQQQQTAATGGFAVSRTRWSWDPTPGPNGNPVTYTLTVGNTTQTFSVTDNSASGVAQAINGLAGQPVQATVVDLGSGTNHDYRIQLQSNAAGAMNLDLSRSTSFSLQTQGQTPGRLAQYEVNNSGVTETSDSRNVQVSTGTTLTIKNTGTTDLTVIRSTSTLSAALSSFADAYNAVVIELNGQRGQSGGALQGQSILNTLTQALTGIGTYGTPGSSIGSLHDLGLDLGVNGQLTYTSLNLMSADIGNSAGVTAFIGSTTGGGFLKAATDALNGLLDSTSGLLTTSESDLQTQITNLGNTISDKQNQVNQMQAQMDNQMAQSDALIASMQQQYSYMSNMFQAMQTADLMYANGA